MELEIKIYLLLAVICYAWRRAISGMKNAAFYGKGQQNPHPRLIKFIKNLHFLETPAWYTQAGQMFFCILAVFRVIHEELFTSLLLATMITLSGSGIAGPIYQGFINLADSKDFVDDAEKRESEFAWGPISFWWPRPWFGIYRVFLAVFWGLFIILLGLTI
ncbi:MAG: hypothetical protein AAFR61_15265 [Bacteroidota bacterium]